MSSDWSILPGVVRAAIGEHTGKVVGHTPVEDGNHADFTAVLDTAMGPVFAKGARIEPERQDIRTLRREAAVAPHISAYAPRLLWHVEAGGWLVLGFEYIAGRHADYSPGSPDLAILAATIHALQATPCPDAVTHPLERRWARFTDDLSPLAGDHLVHADLNPSNLLITPTGRAYVVDWAFTSRGAPWLELGLLLPWLLRDGMSPVQAAAWIEQFPSWKAADPAHIDHFTHLLAEQWRRAHKNSHAPWVAELAALTARWADYRSADH